MSRTSFTAGLAVASLVSATLAGGAFAATPGTAGDAFADALVQSGSTWIANLDTAGATLEPGEAFATPDPAVSRTGTVWLSWTAPEDASIALHASTHSTGVALYTGASLETAAELVFSATGVVASRVTAGETYHVQVSAIGAVDVPAPVLVELTVTGDEPVAAPDPEPTPAQDPQALFGDAPFNDRFAAAGVPTGEAWTHFVNNESAGTETGERLTFDEVSGWRIFNTVWLKWKAPATGSVTIDTYGSATEETSLAVFTGTKVNTAVRIAANDDAAQGDKHSRITSLSVTKNVVYAIQVGSVSQSAASSVTGSMQVNLVGTYAAPSNDNKGKAPAMTGGSWTSAGTTIGSTIETGFEPTSNPQTAANKRQNSIWWKWIALASGTVDVTTVGSTSTIYLAAFEESPTVGMMPAGFDQDLNSHGAVLHVPVIAGHTYYFQAGDITETRGTVKLQFAAVYTGPYITKVAPVAGKLAGGNTITITGSRLTGVTDVKIGGILSTKITHVGSTKLLVKVPAGVSRKKVVVVAYAGSAFSVVRGVTHYTYK
ncbi:hypothetical protein EYE40_15070 [Glaciihabitans arcticus]|uniref:IPT/TIG domain-containing protein n=1 Tax=Glaciihabitans arcticus TaxID=2668039 RepID=A0A4Q9GMF3_9MICO|nr:IPT/TIG domain-containing protein [Glaciihabitans arcticus]TBN55518.1 hypothetical protein EYE40_15070 [Glaciihabitans arcticus]